MKNYNPESWLKLKDQFTPGWRLSEAAIARLLLLNLEPGLSVLEYGPGWSTFVVQEHLKPVKHICVDEPGVYGNAFAELAAEAGLGIDYLVRANGDYFGIVPFGPEKFDLVIVDGPAAIGSRGVGYDTIMQVSRSDSVIIVDDTHRKNEAELAQRLYHSGNWKVEVIKDADYPRTTTFLIGR